MKNLFMSAILILGSTSIVSAYEIPMDVVNGVANESWGSHFDPALSKKELKAYFLENWSEISDHVEAIPTHKFDPRYGKKRVLSVHSAFYENCEGLEPLEYLNYLEKMLVLYEQKRITDGEFKFIALPSLEKQDFLSVNYEHPRVESFLRKALTLVPKEDESYLICLEKTASGALADNYLTNKSDDAPLPQTLPGIKLKRPWGSLIKKYERITGKKVPPDPDFPENKTASRPTKRHATAVSADTSTIKSDSAIVRWALSAAIVAVLLALAAALRNTMKMKKDQAGQ